MLLLVVQLLLKGATALPSFQNITSCVHDGLYTSLSRDGQEFCSRMIKTPCEDEVSTPTLFSSYPSTVLSSYCKCVVTECSWEGTAYPTSTRTWTSQSQNITITSSGSNLATLTITSPQARSSINSGGGGSSDGDGDGDGNGDGNGDGSGDGNGDPTGSLTSAWTGSTTTYNSDGSVHASSGASTDPSNSLNTFTTLETTTSAVSSSSDPGFDTSSTTTTGSSTSESSVNATATSRSSDPSSISASSVTLSGGANGDPTNSIQNNTFSTSGSQVVITSTATGVTTTPFATKTNQTSISSDVPPSVSITHVFSTISGSSRSDSVLSSSSAATSDPEPMTTRANQPSLSYSSATGWNATILTSIWGSGSISGTGVLSATTVTNTAAPSGPQSDPVITSSSGTINITSATWTSPPFITPSGFNTSTLTHIGNATQTSLPTLPAANFTQVTRTAAIIKPTCYQMPGTEGESTKRALLHNTNLRERNATIPFPYIESVDFQNDGVDPLYLTLRDAAEGTHYIDISNRSYISIVDSLYNAMVIDSRGIHFSTKDCKYDVSITIDDMYQQLAKLSGQTCSSGQQRKRMDDMDFRQTIYLRDQCNNPVKRTVRKYPELKVGDTDCNDIEVDETTGRWLFDCTFPGSDSGTLKCQWAVRNDIEEFLFTDPFGGACPDLSTVITTLEANSQDFINPDSLRAELYNQGLDEAQRGEADLSVMYYEQLWEILKQAFSKLRTRPPGKTSAIQEYIDTYNQYRNFENDICEDLHAGDMPLKMSLRAGVTYIDTVTRLNWAPENPKPYNLTIQDPSKQACCPTGSTAQTDPSTGVCSYPYSAQIRNTGCICGKTAAGASIAFEYMECDNFVSQCVLDADCASAGHASYVCLTGTCCGGGVCVDPYECAQNGTTLVTTGFF